MEAKGDGQVGKWAMNGIGEDWMNFNGAELLFKKVEQIRKL